MSIELKYFQPFPQDKGLFSPNISSCLCNTKDLAGQLLSAGLTNNRVTLVIQKNPNFFPYWTAQTHPYIHTGDDQGASC